MTEQFDNLIPNLYYIFYLFNVTELISASKTDIRICKNLSKITDLRGRPKTADHYRAELFQPAVNVDADEDEDGRRRRDDDGDISTNRNTHGKYN